MDNSAIVFRSHTEFTDSSQGCWRSHFRSEHLSTYPGLARGKTQRVWVSIQTSSVGRFERLRTLPTPRKNLLQKANSRKIKRPSQRRTTRETRQHLDLISYASPTNANSSRFDIEHSQLPQNRSNQRSLTFRCTLKYLPHLGFLSLRFVRLNHANRFRGLMVPTKIYLLLGQ